MIDPITTADDDWLALRLQLWPRHSAGELRTEMLAFCADPQRFGQFIARAGDGRALGFAEVSMRSDPVPGTGAAAVGYLEGLYVVPEARRRGIARALVAAARGWARDRGAAEFASDALLANTDSQAMHRALGFVETERVVFFRLDDDGG